MTGRICAVAMAIAALLSLGGCGGGGSRKETNVVQGVHVAAVIPVHETEYRLQPSLIHIDRFGYYGLRAINDGKVAHALAIKGHGLDKRTPAIKPHDSATMLVFFRKAGRYELYCPVDGHAEKGMKGTVKVH
jgi:plastocyanin